MSGIDTVIISNRTQTLLFCHMPGTNTVIVQDYLVL